MVAEITIENVRFFEKSILLNDFSNIWIFLPKWPAIFSKIGIVNGQIWLKRKFCLIEIVKNPAFYV